MALAILAALVPAALAQSQSNPLIPSGISTTCNTYLTTLNNDTGFLACTNPFTTALAKFAPGAGTPSAADVSSALGLLCQPNAFSACPQSTVSSQLSSFYAACPAELASNNSVPAVMAIYDFLFSLVPFRQAVCSKDDSGNYCATRLSNTSSTGDIALVDPEKSQKQTLLSKYLYSTTDSGTVVTRDVTNSTPVLTPNITTYKDTNLLFFFLQPSMPASTLCTTCTRNILTPYITFESNCPYAPGMSHSLLLAGQVSLYTNITSKCGSSFLSGAVQAAGGLSSGLVSGAAPLAVGQELSAALSAILGLAAFVTASL